MAKKTPVNKVTEEHAEDEREAIRDGLNETEAPTKVEIAQAPKRARDRQGR